MRACFFFSFFVLLSGCLFPLSSNAQQASRVCPLGQGFWLDSQNQERCIPCPPASMFDITRTQGLKVPKGCILSKPGVFTTIQDFTTLKIAEEYSLACQKKMIELEGLHKVIQDKLLGMTKDVEQIKSDKITLTKFNQELVYENLDLQYSKRVWIVLTITFGLVAAGEFAYIITR